MDVLLASRGALRVDVRPTLPRAFECRAHACRHLGAASAWEGNYRVLDGRRAHPHPRRTAARAKCALCVEAR
ncbi:hypothetical protein NDU88_003879 [Pleurodeles waltl]|uniref:Uncharacterized protein n=1 Tax=Pleurodeles waltl TaxID=8319 RepID=A0AAV7V1X2_PLEWA|nr:hypothetical protein NDU88_003879 [Pleurodeles waltl]